MKFGTAIRQCLNDSPGLKLVTKQTFQSMLEHRPPLGFMVESDESGKIKGYGHPGGGPGQSSFLHTWLTDPPITVVVLSNYSGRADVMKPWLDHTLSSLIL